MFFCFFSVGDYLKANPSAELFFSNGCTQKHQAILYKKGVLQLQIKEVPLHAEVSAIVTMEAVASGQDEKQQKREWNLTFHAQQKGEVAWSQHTAFVDRPNQLLTKAWLGISHSTWQNAIWWVPTTRQFRAKVEWIIRSSGKTTKGYSKVEIFIPYDKKEHFFRPKKESTCHWQTPLSIASEYHLNEEKGTLYLSFSHLVNNEKGIYIHNDNALAIGVLPINLYAPVSLQYPYGFYFDRYYEYLSQSNRYHSFFQRWELQPGEGGFFVDGVEFDRYQVDQYIPTKDIKGCLSWKKGREGYLDVGTTLRNFYLVPSDLANDLDKADHFINTVRRPMQNSCQQSEWQGQEEYALIGAKEKIYFYPVKNF